MASPREYKIGDETTPAETNGVSVASSTATPSSSPRTSIDSYSSSAAQLSIADLFASPLAMEIRAESKAAFTRAFHPGQAEEQKKISKREQLFEKAYGAYCPSAEDPSLDEACEIVCQMILSKKPPKNPVLEDVQEDATEEIEAVSEIEAAAAQQKREIILSVFFSYVAYDEDLLDSLQEIDPAIINIKGLCEQRRHLKKEMIDEDKNHQDSIDLIDFNIGVAIQQRAAELILQKIKNYEAQESLQAVAECKNLQVVPIELMRLKKLYPAKGNSNKKIHQKICKLEELWEKAKGILQPLLSEQHSEAEAEQTKALTAAKLVIRLCSISKLRIGEAGEIKEPDQFKADWHAACNDAKPILKTSRNWWAIVADIIVIPLWIIQPFYRVATGQWGIFSASKTNKIALNTYDLADVVTNTKLPPKAPLK